MLILRQIDQWRDRTKLKRLFSFWKVEGQEGAKEKRSADFCDQFYQRGILMRSMRHWKLFAEICGHHIHERRMKERIQIEVTATVEQKKNELKFLEALIKELEEKHRIELRKKAILKN